MSDLALSYLRRKRWEAKLLAAELGPLFAGMWGGSQSPSASGNNNGRIPASQMFADMGVVIQ